MLLVAAFVPVRVFVLGFFVGNLIIILAAIGVPIPNVVNEA